jgi:pilus assembly protein CpaE
MDIMLYDANEEIKDSMIVFASAKGGVGKTVISVNMAVALAKKGFSTCVIDGNFQFGDVNLALDIQPKLTISDIVQDIKTLDDTMLSNYLHKHDSGLKVLSSPLKPEYADLITPSVINPVCEKILEQNDYLIVDLSSGLSENNITFMELAHKIVLITDLEMAALKNTKIMLRTLKELGMEEKVRIVVNRGDMESVIKFKDVKDILEMNELFFISNNFKVVSKSFNIGIPFVINKPNERISHEITDLVSKFCKVKNLAKRRGRKKQGLMDLFRR